jgi:hypothetical protein
MPISVFPEVTPSSVSGQTFKVPVKNASYKVTGTFTAGVYTITCVSSTIAKVTFYYGTTFTSTSTSGGTVSFNLATDATAVYVQIDTGTDVLVNITKTSNSIPGAEVSGTLDTITTTSTYTQTGPLYVVAIGGGGGGGKGSIGNYGGAGGGSGAINWGFFHTTSSTSVTIGAAGAAATSTSDTMTFAGTTTFGSLLSAEGGQRGGSPNNSNSGGRGGIPNGSAGSGATESSSDNTTATPVLINGTTFNIGGGTAGAVNGSSGTPGGNGGKGAATASAAVAIAPTGYGGGGGGGASGAYANGTAGGPGVVYVIRDF